MELDAWTRGAALALLGAQVSYWNGIRGRDASHNTLLVFAYLFYKDCMHGLRLVVYVFSSLYVTLFKTFAKTRG